VAKVETDVSLDAEVLERVDELAASLGRSRGDIIEDSVRRTVGSATLRAVMARARASGRAVVDEAEAAGIAYSEVDAARAARRDGVKPPA